MPDADAGHHTRGRVCSPAFAFSALLRRWFPRELMTADRACGRDTAARECATFSRWRGLPPRGR